MQPAPEALFASLHARRRGCSRLWLRPAGATLPALPALRPAPLLRAGQQRLRVRMCGSRRGACLRMRERGPGHRLRMRGRRDGNDLRLCRRCGPRLRMRRRDAREAGLRLCGDPAGLQLLCAQSDRHEQLLLRALAGREHDV